MGLPHSASAYLRCALRCADAPAGYYAELGDLLVATGQNTEAIAAFLRAIGLAPNRASHFTRLGHALQSDHRTAAAMLCYAHAHRISQADTESLKALGDLCRRQGRLAEAVRAYRRALELTPRDAHCWRGLGQTYLDAGSWQEAASAFRTGLDSAPLKTELLAGLGEALLESGHHGEALGLLLLAVHADPPDIRGLQQLCRAHDLLSNSTEAAAAWLRLGSELGSRARYREAETAYKNALARGADDVAANVELGRIYIALGEPQQAIQHLKAALETAPNHVQAQIRLGQAFHLTGDRAQGWAGFEWVYHPENKKPRNFAIPVWDGSPLNGRSLLLWTDQGLGDVILFLRYAGFAKDHGGRVFVECRHRNLVPFVKRMADVDAVDVDASCLPACDVHVPLIHFPSIVRSSRTWAPSAVPYLSVAPDLIRAWRRRLAATPPLKTIGLSWAGNASHPSAASRFIPLRTFSPLGDVPGIRLISLQHGPQTAELFGLPPELYVERVLDPGSSIEDAAALMLNLDLVITVDTMIAHLAGALGVRVWTLLRYATNWVWKSSGDRSEWYPTMTLFRQASAGDWDDAVARIVSTLRMEQAIGDQLHREVAL
jgi:tetratricopeptide (TPR) repeat protein